MAKVQRVTFHIIDGRGGGPVPRSGIYAVLDTNVLSAMESLSKRGYRDDILEHRRAAHLLRWFLELDVDYVSTDFAIVEGAGFHAGGVSLHNVLFRSVPFEALRRLDEPELESFLRSGTGILAHMPSTALEEHYANLLDQTQETMRTTFGPAYLVALELRAAFRDGAPPPETINRVIDLLAKDLNVVPGVPWAAATLFCFGTNKVRQAMAHKVLKCANPAARKSVLSGAWDLAYLQFLTLLRTQVSHFAATDISTPVVITDDDGLADLAALLPAEHGGIAIDEALIDPKHRRHWHAAHRAMSDLRSTAVPGEPDLATIEALARGREERLGIEPSRLKVLPPSVSPEPDKALLLALLDALPLRGADLLTRLADIRACHPGDLLFAGVQMVGPLTMDNATARGRSTSATLESVVTRVRRDTEVTGPQIGEMLVAAAVRQDHISGNALLERVEVVQTSLYGPALVYVAVFLQELLTDTAESRGEELANVLQRLSHRVRDGVPDGGAHSTDEAD